jgi:hypothetical protein
MDKHHIAWAEKKRSRGKGEKSEKKETKAEA